MSSTAHGGAERDGVALAEDLEQLVWRRPGLTELARIDCSGTRLVQRRLRPRRRAAAAFGPASNGAQKRNVS
jgi:hypothetical protein